jgi:hypothetical protein
MTLPSNVSNLTSYHPGNELKADAPNSYPAETEELPYPQNRPSSPGTMIAYQTDDR